MTRVIAVGVSLSLVLATVPPAAQARPEQAQADFAAPLAPLRAPVINALEGHLAALNPLLPAAGRPIEPNLISAYLIQHADIMTVDTLPGLLANRFLVESMRDPALARRVVAALSRNPSQEASLGRLVDVAERLHSSDSAGIQKELKRLDFLRRSLTSEGDPALEARKWLKSFDGAADAKAVSEPSPAAVDASNGTSETPMTLMQLMHASETAAQGILDRAQKNKVSLASLGQALQESRTLDEASERLATLGVLERSAPAEGGVSGIVLQLLWTAASAETSAPFSYDSTRELPAIVVKRNGVDFHIHGIIHGAGAAPIQNYFKVGRLARSLRRDGLELYSEQNILSIYGLLHGRELSDHALMQGKPAALRPPEGLGMRLLAAHGALAPYYLAGFAMAGVKQLLWPALGWTPGHGLLWGVALAGAALALRISLQLYVLKLQVLLRMWRNPTPPLITAFLRATLNWITTVANPERARATALPMPLRMADGMGLDLDRIVRSQAMADLVLADAAKRGLREAHILNGDRHSEELAWFLVNLAWPSPYGH